MNKFLLLIAVCLMPASVLAQSEVAVGVGISSPAASRIPNYHYHPKTPLLNEDFENPSGYDLFGWGVDFGGEGVINPDYTTTVIQGAQSLFIDGSADDPSCITNSFAANGHVWLSFKARVVVADAPPPEMSLIRLRDASGNTLMKVTYDSSDSPNLRIYPAGSGTSYQPSDSISLNTTYTFWVEWWKNNGVNSFGTLAFSSNGIRPKSGNGYVEGTESTVSADASVVLLGSPGDENGSNGTRIYDHILVDDEQIGNFP